MTTITHSQNRPETRRQGAQGFTLVEVMVGASLASFILAATLTCFLFLGRSGANLRNYSDMEAQARKSLEMFAEDTRQASAVNWTGPQSVTLTVNSNTIIYAFSSGVFTRSNATSTTTLLTGITNFTFSAYDINGGTIMDGTTTVDFSSAAARTAANNSTKQVQIALSASRTTTTVTTATNIVLSARYVLRNKKVTA